ncbi:MAG: regulatory protein RecX [Pseudomonadota bacterium]
MDNKPQPVKLADLRDAALRLLARREHSYLELSRKLRQRGWPEPELEQVLDELAEQGLQSDDRFAESFVRMRSQKAYGPIRIRAELGERGIDRSQIERALREAEVDWLELASGWYERRYLERPVDDLKEKARRQQALARRGFSHEVIRALF